MAKPLRDFKGVFIPKELSPELSAMEKLIFAEINSLDNDFGCVVGNEHFAAFFGLKERQIQNILKSLKEKGIISVTINKADDTRVIRVIGKFARESPTMILRG